VPPSCRRHLVRRSADRVREGRYAATERYQGGLQAEAPAHSRSDPREQLRWAILERPRPSQPQPLRRSVGPQTLRLPSPSLLVSSLSPPVVESFPLDAARLPGDQVQLCLVMIYPSWLN